MQWERNKARESDGGERVKNSLERNQERRRQN